MRLLEDRHDVTAFARQPSVLEISHPRLNLVAADVMDPEAVGKALVAQDAAIVTLGSGKSLSSQVRSQGTENIVKPCSIAALSGSFVSRPWARVTAGVI